MICVTIVARTIKTLHYKLCSVFVVFPNCEFEYWITVSKSFAFSGFKLNMIRKGFCVIRIDDKYIKNLNNILDSIEYIYFLKNIRGVFDFADPWFDFDGMLSALEYLNVPNQQSIKLLSE